MRRKSLSVLQRNLDLLNLIKSLKAEHPFWGYRRVWSYLRFRQGLSVNKKRIYRLMKDHNFLVTKNFRLRAKRTKLRPKPRASRPNQFWGIDMTKIKLHSWGWLYLVIVLDWCSKEIVGYSLGLQFKTSDWLLALNRAVNSRFPRGIRDSLDHTLHLVSDNGCQPTSASFMQHCSDLAIKQIFASWSNPKGNSDTERVMRTIKEDFVWPYEWDDPFAFEIGFAQWVDRYNRDFPHQALNDQTPMQFYQNFRPPVLQSGLNQLPALP